MLNYLYFKKYYEIIIIDLSKLQELDDNQKVTWHISFTGNLEGDGNTTIVFILEKSKEIILDFLQKTVRVLKINSALIQFQ